MPASMANNLVVTWAPVLHLGHEGLEVKVDLPPRMRPGFIGARHWQSSDFVKGEAPVLGQWISALRLPRGRLLLIPVGEDTASYWMCPCCGE